MKLNISETSNKPLYSQIKEEIRMWILAGSVQGPLPSIRELAKDNSMSVITVQKAYQELVDEGLIYVRRAKGFFAAALNKEERKALVKKELLASCGGAISIAKQQGLDKEDIIRSLNDFLHQI